METEEATMRDRNQEAMQKKELEESYYLIGTTRNGIQESKSGPTMDAHEYINHELDFDLMKSLHTY
jgi:hypothetical protein